LKGARRQSKKEKDGGRREKKRRVDSSEMIERGRASKRGSNTNNLFRGTHTECRRRRTLRKGFAFLTKKKAANRRGERLFINLREGRECP